MARPPQPAIASLCAAASTELLRDLVVPILEQRLAALDGDPLIASESRRLGSLPAKATRWLERCVSRTGHLATTIEPGHGYVIECGDPAPKFAVTQLALKPDPALADQLYAIGIWSRFIGRRRRWAMRLSPTLMADIAANAACANPMLTVQVARWRTVWLAAVAEDLIAAEVAGRALRSVLQPSGDTGNTPWQSPLVQAAGERALGVANGGQMAIELEWSGPPSHPDWQALRARAVRVAHLIDCPLTLVR